MRRPVKTAKVSKNPVIDVGLHVLLARISSCPCVGGIPRYSDRQEVTTSIIVEFPILPEMRTHWNTLGHPSNILHRASPIFLQLKFQDQWWPSQDSVVILNRNRQWNSYSFTFPPGCCVIFHFPENFNLNRSCKLFNFSWRSFKILYWGQKCSYLVKITHNSLVSIAE